MQAVFALSVFGCIVQTEYCSLLCASAFWCVAGTFHINVYRLFDTSKIASQKWKLSPIIRNSIYGVIYPSFISTSELWGNSTWTEQLCFTLYAWHMFKYNVFNLKLNQVVHSPNTEEIFKLSCWEICFEQIFLIRFITTDIHLGSSSLFHVKKRL